MAITLSRSAFEKVSQLFHDVSGIRLGEAKHALVSGRLQKLAYESGERDLERYVARLLRGEAPPDEMTRVIDRLTTNETYFFREPQHFAHLAEHVAQHPRGEEFLAWSAASSSGEEAYTVAMVLADSLGTAPWRVIGTDLSTAMVEAARRGLYPLDRASMVPAATLKRWCLKGHGDYEGQLLVSRDLRARVQFQCANLMQPLPNLPLFDVIFLRNVLIYFDTPAKAQIVQRVMERLRPDGVLYTGHAESLTGLGVPLRQLATAVYTHG